MQSALRMTAWVQPGGKVEVCNDQLPPGTPVDVIVMFAPTDEGARPSIRDILSQAPGHLAFRNADEVDAYLREEREAWERSL